MCVARDDNLDSLLEDNAYATRSRAQSHGQQECLDCWARSLAVLLARATAACTAFLGLAKGAVPVHDRARSAPTTTLELVTEAEYTIYNTF